MKSIYWTIIILVGIFIGIYAYNSLKPAPQDKGEVCNTTTYENKKLRFSPSGDRTVNECKPIK